MLTCRQLKLRKREVSGKEKSLSELRAGLEQKEQMLRQKEIELREKEAGMMREYREREGMLRDKEVALSSQYKGLEDSEFRQYIDEIMKEITTHTEMQKSRSQLNLRKHQIPSLLNI